MPLPPLFATPLVSAPEVLSPLLPLAPVPPAPLGAAPLLPLPEIAFPLCAPELEEGPEGPHPSARATSDPLTMEKWIPAVGRAPNRRERNAGGYTPSRQRTKREGAHTHHVDNARRLARILGALARSLSRAPRSEPRRARSILADQRCPPA
jgi:hypothetical protein